MTEAAEIRMECVSCGGLFFPTSQHADCPHEFTTTFTRGAMKLLRDLLHHEETAQ